MYKATATIYVVSRNDSVLNFSDLQVGSELTSDVSRQELLDVKQQIEQTGCPILGTVLNQVDYDNYMPQVLQILLKVWKVWLLQKVL